MKLIQLIVYFKKRPNGLITRCFYWFLEHVAPLYSKVPPTVVYYSSVNCFTEVKRVLQNENLCAFEGCLKIRLQIVHNSYVKGTNGLKQHQNSFYIFYSSFYA